MGLQGMRKQVLAAIIDVAEFEWCAVVGKGQKGVVDAKAGPITDKGDEVVSGEDVVASGGKVSRVGVRPGDVDVKVIGAGVRADDLAGLEDALGDELKVPAEGRVVESVGRGGKAGDKDTKIARATEPGAGIGVGFDTENKIGQRNEGDVFGEGYEGFGGIAEVVDLPAVADVGEGKGVLGAAEGVAAAGGKLPGVLFVEEVIFEGAVLGKGGGAGKEWLEGEEGLGDGVKGPLVEIAGGVDGAIDAAAGEAGVVGALEPKGVLGGGKAGGAADFTDAGALGFGDMGAFVVEGDEEGHQGKLLGRLTPVQMREG